MNTQWELDCCMVTAFSEMYLKGSGEGKPFQKVNLGRILAAYSIDHIVWVERYKSYGRTMKYLVRGTAEEENKKVKIHRYCE